MMVMMLVLFFLVLLDVLLIGLGSHGDQLCLEIVLGGHGLQDLLAGQGIPCGGHDGCGGVLLAQHGDRCGDLLLAGGLGAAQDDMGMLVDNAIVVTDNAQIAIKRGIRRRQALIDGATTPQWGLLGATMIAVFSFLPLYLAQSSVAEMIKPLFIVLAVSLLLSWVLALAQTTVFGNFILKEGSGETGKDPYDTPFYHKFGKFLRLLIRFKGTTMLVMVGLFMLAMTIMGLMPQNFFPNMDKPYLRADCFLPEGYSIRETEKEMGKIEEFLLQQEEVVNVSATYGSSPLRYYLASTSFGPKSNFGNFLVEVKDKKYTAQVEERLNKYVRENYPDILIRSSLFKLSPAVEANIEFGFIGENIDTLTMLTEKAMSIMHECDMVTDIKNSWGNKVPVWEPAYSQERGQRLGITRQAVAYALKIATNGLPLGDYREKDLFMPILLKEENIESSNIDNMKTLPVFSQSGYAVPLAQVVDSFAFGYNYNVIKRYNRDKVMMAQCDSKRGANTMAAFAQVKKAITEGMDIPQEDNVFLAVVMCYTGTGCRSSGKTKLRKSRIRLWLPIYR